MPRSYAKAALGTTTAARQWARAAYLRCISVGIFHPMAISRANSPCQPVPTSARGVARGPLLVLGLACAAASLAACAEPVTIDAAVPTSSATFVAPDIPDLASSVVDAPISIELGSTLELLESAVPRTFGDIEHRITNPKNRRQEFAFEATRSPFTVSLDDGLLTLGTVVSYQGRGWYNASLLPDVRASCGTDGAQPRLRARLQTPVDISSDWTLRTKAQLTGLAPYSDTERDACRVTILDIDVTERVADAVRGVMRRELPKVDRKLAGWDLRDRVDGWYNQMNRPIRVADSLWLLLRPGAVRLGSVNTTDSALVIDVRLFANPVIVSGSEPARTETPLPQLQPSQGDVGDSARVLLEASIGYTVATDLLSDRLIGRKFSRLGRRVTVTGVRLVPVGDGRIALGLRFIGALQGEGWLVGTPKLDVANERLTVPDLDFDVATGDVLVQGLAFLRTPAVLAQLRDAAVLPLRDPLEALREKVEGAINRELTDGVKLSATLMRGRLVDVVAMPYALIVRAEAVGTLGLDIDRELSVKKPL